MPTVTDNFELILEFDPNNPFEVDSLYPCVVIPDYTCPSCHATIKMPICVKDRSGTRLYCRSCHSPIKTPVKTSTNTK